jgi:hypothetical protein
LRECRREFVHEIGAQCSAPLGILAFGPIGDPAVELGEKLAGMKLLARPPFWSCLPFRLRTFFVQPYDIFRDMKNAGTASGSTLASSRYRRMPPQAYCRTRRFRWNCRQHRERNLIYLLFFPTVFRED